MLLGHWTSTMPPQLLRGHCLHAPPPLAKPLANPHRPLQLRAHPPPAGNTHHHQRMAGVCKHPLTAQLPADARSVPTTSSDVSFAIIARLGASDAAPSSPILLSARIAAPRQTPRQIPTHPLQPRAQPPQPTARNIIHAQSALANTSSHCSCPPMHAAYHRGSATSAASSLRDSVPATLLHLLGYY